MGVTAKIGTAGAALVVAAGAVWSLGPGLNGLSDDAAAIALGIATRPPVVAPPQEAPAVPPVPETGRPTPDRPGVILPVNRPATPAGVPSATPVPPGVPQPEVPPPSAPPSVPSSSAPVPPAVPSRPVTPSPTQPSPVPPPDPAPAQPATGCVSDTRLGSLICAIAGALS